MPILVGKSVQSGGSLSEIDETTNLQAAAPATDLTGYIYIYIYIYVCVGICPTDMGMRGLYGLI